MNSCELFLLQMHVTPQLRGQRSNNCSSKIGVVRVQQQQLVSLSNCRRKKRERCKAVQHLL